MCFQSELTDRVVLFGKWPSQVSFHSDCRSRSSLNWELWDRRWSRRWRGRGVNGLNMHVEPSRELKVKASESLVRKPDESRPLCPNITPVQIRLRCVFLILEQKYQIIVEGSVMCKHGLVIRKTNLSAKWAVQITSASIDPRWQMNLNSFDSRTDNSLTAFRQAH